MISADEYINYFPVGLKVGVGIPMHNAETFRDWAIIHDIEEDLVYLQLSRDQLPMDVSLHVGQILELRGGKEGSGYSCRAIIVSEDMDRNIILRLIGEIITDELREFYRIDAFLPVKYYLLDEQHISVLEKEWTNRRELRMADELMRKQQPWGGDLALNDGAVTAQQDKQETPAGPEEDEWDEIIPLAANISGGGIRIQVHRELMMDEYVRLEILVPAPHCIVDVVAKVVSVHHNRSVAGERDSYSVGMKFVCINERDRDAIVNYISNIQLKRIRQLRMQFALRDGVELTDQPVPSHRLHLIYIALLLLAVTAIGFYLWNYIQYRPKSEIEEIFEEGVRKQRQKIGK